MKKIIIGLSFLTLLACQKAPVGDAPKADQLNAVAVTATTDLINPALLGAFAALPTQYGNPANSINDDKINLGRKLYFDTRLSVSNTISCNSCHKLDAYGVDGEKTSLGHKGERGDRNSPTVYNAAGHFLQFWDGRAQDVEEQAKGPVLNPVEMGMKDEAAVLVVLKSDPVYVEAFKKAFPEDAEPLTYNNMGRAIGAFERKLVTPSRWDDYLSGNKGALTEAEKKGFIKFTETGCQTCHNGALVGGGMFMKLGLVTPWPYATDLGRFKVTNNEADKMLFKVPSLRNIEKTAPYFHDGSVATLNEAVEKMALHQLGKTLAKEDVDSIVTWLKSLTGELPTDYIKKP